MNNTDIIKKKIRGTATLNAATNEFSFVPFNEGQSSQTNVKTCKGGGKAWETTGSDPSRMLTLKCKVSEADPYAELSRQFNMLTKNMKPKKPITMPSEQRVVSEEGLQCWLNSEKGSITFTGNIDLNRHSRDWQAEVLRMVQLVVRRLPASDSFNKIINNINKERRN